MNLPGSSGMSAVADIGEIQGIKEYRRLSNRFTKAIIDRP